MRPAQDDGAGSAPTLAYSLRSATGADGQPRYSLHRGEDEVVAGHDPQQVIRHLLWLISSDTAELAESHLLVHAGAVVTPGGDGVVILGESGSGKTTLVAALVQEGFGFLSDEAAAIGFETGLVHPWPRPLGFRLESRTLPRFAALFAPGSAVANEIHIPIGKIRQGAVAAPASVRHVINHLYQPGVPTRLEPLSRGIALVQMGSAAPRLRREGQQGLAVLAGVMRGARAYSLIGGDLERSVSAVQECVT